SGFNSGGLQISIRLEKFASLLRSQVRSCRSRFPLGENMRNQFCETTAEVNRKLQKESHQPFRATFSEVCSSQNWAIRLLLACTLFTATAYGQAVYGSISGTIVDSSGAGVVGAKVSITDQERNIQFLTTSGDGGHYSQSHLIIGKYRIQVEMVGFN